MFPTNQTIFSTTMMFLSIIHHLTTYVIEAANYEWVRSLLFVKVFFGGIITTVFFCFGGFLLYIWAHFNPSMRNNYYSIIYTLVIFSHCITFGNFNDPTNEYNFQIEFIDWVWRSMSPHKLYVTGPKLPLNKDYLERVCDAAKNYISLDKNPEYRLSVCLEPGRITYPDKVVQFENLHVLWCNTIPQVWLRATEGGELIIMIEYSVFVSDEKLSFDVKTIKSEPKPYTGRRVSENEDNRLRIYFNSIEALHICWQAKKHIKFLKPMLYGSDVGGQVFAFQYDDGGTEKRLTLKCPSRPIMFVYFGDSEEDIRVVLVQENFRKRKRKITNPHHYIIPLNLAEDNKETR